MKAPGRKFNHRARRACKQIDMFPETIPDNSGLIQEEGLMVLNLLLLTAAILVITGLIKAVGWLVTLTLMVGFASISVRRWSRLLKLIFIMMVLGLSLSKYFSGVRPI